MGQQAQFQVAPAFLLGNRGRTVSSLLIDFDNGAGPVTCLPGQPVGINYPTAGNKVLRFTVSFTDGTTAQAREVRRVTAPQTAQLPTAALPEGLYYLVVEQNGYVSRSQIRVQH